MDSDRSALRASISKKHAGEAPVRKAAAPALARIASLQLAMFENY